MTVTTSHPPAPIRNWPLALLLILLGLMWLALLARGLNLGFTGDLLDYAFHYERLGTFGGMHWLVTEHLQRHLFAPLFSAPIAYVFPDQSAAWYAYALLAHFANAVMVCVLADTVLRARSRWLSFAAALLFAFHGLQLRLNFEFPTSGHGNSALFLSLLSLWLYLQYVRRGRANHLWLEFSLAAYIFAIGTYEQTALFFLLHPVIAYFEDRHNGSIGELRVWLLRVARDSFWFPVFVIVYVFLLRILFVAGDHLILRPSYLFGQLAAGISAEFAPGGFLARLAPAFETGTLVITLALSVGLFALILWTQRGDAKTNSTSHGQDNGLFYLTVLGGAIMLVSILGVAPTQWAIPEHPRMIYPSAVGFAFLLTGAAGLVSQRVYRIRFAVALAVALLVGAGAVRMFQIQDEFAAQDDSRQRVLDAVKAAVPAFAGDEPPYLLLYSDANPTTDLWLYAQDNRFPLMFNRLYDSDNIAADALYFGLDNSLAPPDEMPGRRYNGQFIVVEPEGIYSPLRPYEPIDPARLVIVYYDSVTGEAAVMDALPPEVVERANIVQRARISWETNHGLIEPTAP